MTRELGTTYLSPVSTADNLTAFRAFNPERAGEVVHLLGASIPGDGGGGTFYWSTTSEAADDDGVTTVASLSRPTTAGRWVRLDGLEVDGSTPYLLTELATRPIIAGYQITNVPGYYVPGDGGGGQFVKTSSAGLTTNPGTIFASSDSAYYWVRIYSGAIDVRWFGAKGDGETDDTAAIQAAIDVVRDSLHGGAVLFPAGRWVIKNTINCTTSVSLTLIGEMPFNPQQEYVTDGAAKNSCIIIGQTISGPMFLFDQPAGHADGYSGAVRVEGLSFYDPTSVSAPSYPGSRTCTAALSLLVANYSSVHRCHFSNINGTAIFTGFFVMGNISDCRVQYCGGSGIAAIFLGDGSRATQSLSITNCKLEVNHGPYIELTSASGQVKIVACGFETDAVDTPESNQNFIKIDDGSGGHAIVGCHFNRNQAVQVNIIGDQNTISNCSFFDGPGDTAEGLNVSGRDNSISNCVFVNSKTSHEVVLGGQNNSLSSSAFRYGGNILLSGINVLIANCTLYQLSTTEDYWIDIQGDQSAAIGNGLRESTPGFKGGIRLAAVQSPRAIGNNIFGLGGGIAILSQGTGIVVGNSEAGCSSSYSETSALSMVAGNQFQTSGNPRVYTISWTPGTIAPGATTSSSGVIYAGLAVSDRIVISPSAALDPGVILTARVPSTGYIQAMITNTTASPVTLGAMTFYAEVIR
jgi:hypothetical protein